MLIDVGITIETGLVRFYVKPRVFLSVLFADADGVNDQDNDRVVTGGARVARPCEGFLWQVTHEKDNDQARKDGAGGCLAPHRKHMHEGRGTGTHSSLSKALKQASMSSSHCCSSWSCSWWSSRRSSPLRSSRVSATVGALQSSLASVGAFGWLSRWAQSSLPAEALEGVVVVCAGEEAVTRDGESVRRASCSCFWLSVGTGACWPSSRCLGADDAMLPGRGGQGAMGGR